MTRLNGYAAALILSFSACSGSSDPGDPDDGGPPVSCTFANPIAMGQDPWVVRHGDSYYFVESAEGGILVYRSRELTVPKQNKVKVWTPPASGWNRMHVWAPEMHFVDGRWYIYYAAGSGGPPYIHQRSGVLESVTADPQGQYVDRGMLYTGDGAATGENVWAIDLTVGRIGGRLYAVWSGWEANRTTDKTAQHLYIAPMENPWTIGGPRVRISSPDQTWELGTELDLNEGPEFLFRGDDVFIVYSTRESWLKEYRLGQLRLAAGADPLRAASWTKSGPVFAGTAAVYGAGHASFTKSPDGTEDWIVYHSKISTTPGWQRDVRMQPFGWNADGSPRFGTPVASGEVIPVPSGQCSS